MRMNGGLERSRQTRRKLLKHGADIRAARSEWRLPDLYEGDCGIDVIGPLPPFALLRSVLDSGHSRRAQHVRVSLLKANWAVRIALCLMGRKVPNLS